MVDIVQPKVLSPSKSVVIEAICTPFICSNILIEKYTQLLRNDHTNLKFTHMLRLNTENVINSYFDKEPFVLYFNKVFCTENSNKINEIKDDIYSRFK